MYSRIEGFPIGGRLFSKHRKSMAVPEDFPSIAGESQYSSGTQFAIEDTRDTINRILPETNISPIRSQARATLQHQSKSSLRRLLSKLNRGTASLQEKLAESLAPGQSTYGLTTLRMDSGEKVELSKQMLQSQKTHAIAEYKKYCEETNFEGLCNRKLFDILTGLKPAQQQIVAGLDDFVVEGIEAWQSLSGTCPGQ
ncbi:unnamed protein product [Rotaria magnacalcarata]|uniref:Uncharacterized protein n=1 Tax=Rotaria magnacalcarata TaxID=392030 RepID=A0A820K513_9BILA|nr:unnamed protein product [Rotaria magnacalcarata]